MQSHIYATEFFIRLVFFLLYIFFYVKQRTVNFAKKISMIILNIFIIMKILFYLNELQEMQNDTMENVHWMIDCTSFKLQYQWSVLMQINIDLINYLSLFSFDSKESGWIKLKELQRIRDKTKCTHITERFIKKFDERSRLLRQNHKLRAE